MKYTCAFTSYIRPVHRYIAMLLDLSDRNICLQKLAFKGKAAADQKTDKIFLQNDDTSVYLPVSSPFS